MPMRTRNGFLGSFAAPARIEFGDLALHGERHAQAGAGVFGDAFRLGIAEENQDGIADELVDGAAMLRGDLRHLGEVFIEEIG